MPFIFFIVFFLTFFLPSISSAGGDRLILNDLITEALKNNHEILSAEAKTRASEFKILQAGSLPDPMFMFGYQNEGWERYTYGDEVGAKWMFSASQIFPYPGKLSLKSEMTSRDSEGQRALAEAIKLKNVANVKSLYYELFLSHKNIELIREKRVLLERIEDAALSRYSTGMALQQEVLMAQTEKYMLMDKEEMFKQKIESTGAMLNAAVGREINAPLARPAEPSPSAFHMSMEQLISLAMEKSPEMKIKQKMLASAEVKQRLADKDYYPDFTVTGTYEKRGGDFMDMWSLTTAVNIPLYYKNKQRQAVYEAKANREEAIHELEGAKSMISSAVKDNYSMMKTAGRLMELYKNGLIPKTYQDFEAALAGYISGKGETSGVIARLRSVIDFEMVYWGQFVEREKAIARLDALTGTLGHGVEEVSQ
ncbi:MAG: TolC family protein [Nitrospirota bacterium]|nr:TolC family protein [Nitrospirota bacterium]